MRKILSDCFECESTNSWERIHFRLEKKVFLNLNFKTDFLIRIMRKKVSYKMASDDLKQLYDHIEDELLWVDIRPYSHNIVGLLLRELEHKYGEEHVRVCLENNADTFAERGWAHLLKEYDIEHDPEARDIWMEDLRRMNCEEEEESDSDDDN